MVYFFKPLFKDKDENFVKLERAKALKGMGEEVQVIPMLKYYNVFNIEDIEGIEIEIPEIRLKDHQRMEQCEAIIKGMKNPPKFVFENANQAYYAQGLSHKKSREWNKIVNLIFHKKIYRYAHSRLQARNNILRRTSKSNRYRFT